MPAYTTDNTQHVIRKLVPALLSWFAANARDLPWRRTFDTYAIWVSEIMLQQTQVKTVIPYWERWMRELPTIQAAAKASPAKLHKLWEGLGYYTRVRNLQKAAQQIVAQQEGKFPENFDEILTLPGIGRYTAGAIASIAFNQPRPILDGNLIRVLTRVFGLSGDPREKKTNSQLWLLAGELVLHASSITHHASSAGSRTTTRTKDEDVRTCSQLNQSLMELGALICTPRNPRCDICPVKKTCVAQKKSLQDKLPNLGKRVRTTERHFTAFVVERNGKFLVRQRPAGVVNAHLWEFPNVEIPGARASCRRVPKSKQLDGNLPARPACDFRLTTSKPLCVIKHSITRYRITLEAWRAKLARAAPKSSGRWLTPAQLDKHAFTSAHKKILSWLR